MSVSGYDAMAMREMPPCHRFRSVGHLIGANGTLTADVSAEIGETVEVQSTYGTKILCEAIGFHEGKTQLLPYSTCDGLRQGATVRSRGRKLSIPVGAGLLGRVVNGLADPIDERGPVGCVIRVRVQPGRPPSHSRPRVAVPLVTGIRAIDAMITLGEGQRVALMAGSGVGKSTLLGDIARSSSADINVIALIGERGREVQPFIEDCLGEEGLRRSVVVVATADQQPLMRLRAAHSAIAISNYFRAAGKRVLFMVDSITRMAAAQREIGLLLGEAPTSRGYTPSTFQVMSSFLEQLGNSQTGSITGVISVLIEGDEVDDPVADAVRSVVDGHIVLDRRLAEHAHFPAINIGKSISRVFPEVTDEEQRIAASAIRNALATYEEVETLIRVGAYVEGTSPRIDKAVRLKSAIDEFVKQGVREHSSMPETCRRMVQIAKDWTQ